MTNQDASEAAADQVRELRGQIPDIDSELDLGRLEEGLRDSNVGLRQEYADTYKGMIEGKLGSARGGNQPLRDILGAIQNLKFD